MQTNDSTTQVDNGRNTNPLRESSRRRRIGFNVDSLRQQSSSHVYALNNTVNVSKKKQVTVVAITVTIPNGGPRLVQVPDTWIPVDLSLQIPKDELVKSPDFLTIVNRQMIKLIPDTEAEDILDDEEAQIEHQRVIDRMNGLSTIMDDEEQRVQDEQTNKMSAPPRPELTDEQKLIQRLHPKVVEMCTSDDMKPPAVYANLKMLGSQFNIDDLRYLSANLKLSSRNVKINSHIEKLIAEASGV